MKKNIYIFGVVMILLILVVIVVGYKINNNEDSLEPSIIESEATTTEEVQANKEVLEFISQYLDAYENIYKNKNYEKVIEFISDSALVQMKREEMPFEKYAADFDNYQIIGIRKTNHMSWADSVTGYEVQVKLYKNKKILTDSNGSENIKITVISENDNLKTPSWYFNQ